MSDDINDGILTANFHLNEEVNKLRAERDALVGACGDLGANLVARDDELAKLRAANERLRAALTDGAKYLDQLEKNIMANDVDTFLDECPQPSLIADNLRAACELSERKVSDAETRINARIKQNPDMG